MGVFVVIWNNLFSIKIFYDNFMTGNIKIKLKLKLFLVGCLFYFFAIPP